MTIRCIIFIFFVRHDVTWLTQFISSAITPAICHCHTPTQQQVAQYHSHNKHQMTWSAAPLKKAMISQFFWYLGGAASILMEMMVGWDEGHCVVTVVGIIVVWSHPVTIPVTELSWLKVHRHNGAPYHCDRDWHRFIAVLYCIPLI